MLILALLALALVAAAAHSIDAIIPRLGFSGPYSRQGEYKAPPPGCFVDRVVSLSRHTERYPMLITYDRFILTLRRLRTLDASGPLEFINNYSLFMDITETGQLTSSGPFNGEQNAINYGAEYKYHYGHLIDGRLSIYAASTERIMNSAEFFAEGMFGSEWRLHANVEVVPESPANGANSLSPAMSCLSFQRILNGVRHPTGYYMKALQPVMQRLSMYVTGALQHQDIETLFNLCAFEINAKGESEFCNIFTLDELDLYEKHSDLYSYYAHGPGSPSSAAVGSVFMEAALRLLEQDSDTNLFPCFAHDIDIQSVVSMLGLTSNGTWTISQITPMGARFVLERLSCGDQTHVRLLLNEKLMMDMPVHDFHVYVTSRLQDYTIGCNLPSNCFVPANLTIFWESES